MTWTKATVGCHWTCGDYTISTFRCGSESGYKLLYRRNLLGAFDMFDSAKNAAAWHNSQPTPGANYSIVA